MIQTMLSVALVLYGIAIAISVIRIIKGPSIPDRVVALDIVVVNLISGIAVITLLLNTRAFLEVILILGILAFIGTIAFSKYIERGVIIERNSDG